jgi:putative phosphoribosyl transferase
MTDRIARSRFEEAVEIDTGTGVVEGTIAVPERARGCVIFAHGSGSGRHSPRNRAVAASLHEAGLATLLLDLLTAEEEQTDIVTGEHRFDIDLLAERLSLASDWLTANYEPHDFRVGYFGASTGAAAALVAAAERPDTSAVVSRGGRPDLAGDALLRVQASTLLIVGGNDAPVVELNRQALEQLSQARNKELRIIPGATHLFPEPGALGEVSRLASQWFGHYLNVASRQRVR